MSRRHVARGKAKNTPQDYITGSEMSGVKHVNLRTVMDVLESRSPGKLRGLLTSPRPGC